MLAGPLTVFVLGVIFGLFISWKINKWLILRRVRNEGIETEQGRYRRRMKDWL